MAHEPSKIQKVLNIYGIVLIIWSIYRVKLSGLGIPEWFDEVIAKPFVFLLPTYIYIVHSELHSFISGIHLYSKSVRKDILIGLGIGSTFFISALAAHIFKHGGIDVAQFKTYSFLILILVTLATAFTEEAFARGFILSRMYADSKNVYSSAFNSSILFLILHIPILFTVPDLRGNLLLIFLATDFVLSLVNSFVFLDRKNIIAPVLIHALYNIALLLYV